MTGRLGRAVWLLALGQLLAYAAAQLGRWAPLANCAVASLPGPDAPLYLLGARMTYYSAIMPISDGMGLVFAVTSYDGKLVVTITSVPEIVPDPAFLADWREHRAGQLAAIRAAAAVE